MARDEDSYQVAEAGLARRAAAAAVQDRGGGTALDVLDTVRRYQWLYGPLLDRRAATGLRQYGDVVRYLHEKVPFGQQVKLVYDVFPCGSGTYPVPGSFRVQRTDQQNLPAAPPEGLPPTYYMTYEEVVLDGLADPLDDPDERWVGWVLEGKKGVIDAVTKHPVSMGPAHGAVMEDPAAAKQRFDALLRDAQGVVDLITMPAPGEQSALPPDTTAADADPALVADAGMDVSPPVVVDLPLPEEDGTVAAASVRALRSATTRSRSPALADLRAADADLRRLLDSLLPAAAPSPVPPHPARGLPSIRWSVDVDRLRKRAGRDRNPAHSPERSLLAELRDATDPQPPLHLPADDATGWDTWTAMQLCGRWRSLAEGTGPGDYVRIADGVAAGGRYDGLVLATSKDGRPNQVLAAFDGVETYRAIDVDPAATVVATWQPRPLPSYDSTSPMGAYWNTARRLPRLIDRHVTYAGGTVDELAALLAESTGLAAASFDDLVVVLGDELRPAGPDTPLWPGTVLLGAGESHLGAVLPDGSVAGATPWDDYPTITKRLSVRRFRPVCVWYPRLGT